MNVTLDDSVAAARKLVSQGKISDALNLLDKSSEFHEQDEEFWMIYGDISYEAGNLIKSAQGYSKITNLNPNNHLAYFKLGTLMTQLNDYVLAEKLLTHAFQTNPCINYATNLADLYYIKESYDKCAEVIDKVKALAKSEKDISRLVLLSGNILINNGKIVEAQKIFETCLFHKEPNFRIFDQYVRSKKINDTDLMLISYYENISKTVKDSVEYSEDLFFGLAKAKEDLKLFAEAAKYFERANKIAAASIKFDRKVNDKIIKGSIEQLTKELIVEKQANIQSGSIPIFVCGLPRSGTTLVEQILSTNSNVYGCGELDLIQELMKKTSIRMPNNGYIHYPYSISLLNRNFFIKAAEIYKKQVTARSNNTKYIIDKMPENITYAGFIKILLPDSKIVHCIRDLRDVALSLYSTHFRERSLAFANSQDDILYYIESYLMIVSHWKKIFPDMIVEIKYSDLLEDFENTTKKLFASCGIDWTKEVFDFHKSKNSVATASRAQVKQPLYKSSKDKWRNYKPYYAEFFHKIEDLANKYNYTW